MANCLDVVNVKVCNPPSVEIYSPEAAILTRVLVALIDVLVWKHVPRIHGEFLVTHRE